MKKETLDKANYLNHRIMDINSNINTLKKLYEISPRVIITGNNGQHTVSYDDFDSNFF